MKVITWFKPDLYPSIPWQSGELNEIDGSCLRQNIFYCKA